MYAQSENYVKYYNKGNKLHENNFEEAEKNFRVAIDDTLSDLRATFNLSNKYYTEGLFDEAISRQIQAVELAKNKSEKHKAFHNLGNSLMSKEMCSEAVKAYKNALRNNPEDDETRYNLALAKKCEDDQNKDDQNKDDQNKDDQNKDDQNKDDQNKDDQNKDDQNNDDQNKDDQNKDDQNKDDQNKDDQNKDDQNKDDQNKPKENKNQQSKLSPQQIKNLLKAMENAEKKVQAKVNDKKQKGTKVVSEKDW
jgi:tetratricopeptide (TPR) repeat protein